MEIVPVEDIPKLEDIVDTPVDNLASLYKTCQEMQELCDQENGVGLSAVQVGIPWRLFVFKESDGWLNMVNCEYHALYAETEKVEAIEGCLSLKEPSGQLKRYNVARFKDVVVTGHRLCDKADELMLTELCRTYFSGGFYGIVCQHEIDHHCGVLISDIGKEVHLWVGNSC